MKKVLILGAGFVVKPMVDYLAKSGYELLIVDRIFSKAEELAKNHKNVFAEKLLTSDDAKLDELIEKYDLTVSLLPANLHPLIAKKCIKFGKNMVTASYVSPEMKALDAEAKQANITILNEVGVDPGIDHMSAMKIIDEVRSKGGKITSFKSYCGGLPAHEANTNPLGYKFSWAPKGVLLAARNNARYLKDGEEVFVDGKDLFADYHLLDVPGAATFEAYANRDSISYIDTYNFKNIKTMFRGTLRNISHCDTWFIFSQLGFFDNEKSYENLEGSIKDFVLEKVLNASKDQDPKAIICKRFNLPCHNIILKKFEWLGLFDDAPIPIKSGTAVDLLTAIMLEKMSLQEGERDLLVMHHKFTAEYPNKTQEITSTLVDFGIKDGDSSMSRTVSLPAAIAVKLILEEQIKLKGVIVPVLPEIYNPILQELEKLDIKLEEKYY